MGVGVGVAVEKGGRTRRSTASWNSAPAESTGLLASDARMGSDEVKARCTCGSRVVVVVVVVLVVVLVLVLAPGSSSTTTTTLLPQVQRAFTSS